MKTLLLTCSLIFLFTNNIYSQTPGTKKWEFLTGGSISSSPAIGKDGTIYVGSDDKKLYAINPDGSKKWELLTGGSIHSSPAIGNDGIIYVGSYDKKLYAINPDGSKKWEFVTSGYIFSSPAIGKDGTIYFGSYNNKLYAIDSDGIKKWEFTTGDDIRYSSPAIGKDGTIYVGSYDKKLYAINPDGSKKWEFKNGSGIDSSPAICKDGKIYVGSDDKKLYAINPDGSKNWEFTTGSYLDSSPAIGKDGTIYLGSYDKKLYAINPDGSKKWEFTTGNRISYTSPAIGNDGTIYVGSDDKKLYAINPDGSKKWEFTTGDAVQSSPAIGKDGTIYMGSDDKKLYAIFSNTTLAETPWPKFRKDLYHSGNSEATIYSKNSFYANYTEGNQVITIEQEFRKSENKKVIITKIEPDNQKFQHGLSLPFIVEAEKSDFIIPMVLSGPNTGLMQSGYKITFTLDNETIEYEDSLEVATIFKNNSEISIVGKRAIEAYNSALDSNNIAVLNNRGVIYRLLGYPELAVPFFEKAIAFSLNKQYGFTGIKMNQGVVQSDMDSSKNANAIYQSSVTDISLQKETSVLAPQIFYNQAWELYVSEDYEGSEPLALQTLNHPKSNAWLKAKAAALLGAIKYENGDDEGALESFQMAYSLDITGPIGAMAQENMNLVTSIPGIANNIGLSVYPQPATDYIVLEYRGRQFSNVQIKLINASGIAVYNQLIPSSGAGLYHSVDVNKLPAGIYNLRLSGEGVNEVRKVIVQ